jgi:hypothetical protein
MRLRFRYGPPKESAEQSMAFGKFRIEIRLSVLYLTKDLVGGRTGCFCAKRLRNFCLVVGISNRNLFLAATIAENRGGMTFEK